MRTGKSKSIIDNACYLGQACEIEGVIVIAPNGVHNNWMIRELPRHHWDELPHVRHSWRFSDGTNQDRFEKFLKQSMNNFSWLAVNMETLIRKEIRSSIVRYMRRHPNILMVFDESHHFARAGAKRTSMARALARRAAYRRILTGTAVENRPLQAFSQYELLEKEALGFTRYGDFERRYAHYEWIKMRNSERMFPKLMKYEHLDELRSRMAKYSSVVLRSDCEDLPPVHRDVRYIEMTPKQYQAWYSIRDTNVEQLESLGMTKALVGGAALIKLKQIEGGFLMDQNGTLKVLAGLWSENPKMQALLDEIQQYDGQVIVWFAFIHEIKAAAEMLESQGITFGEFHGRISDKSRDQTLIDFEKGKIRVILGEPHAGGEGRDFSSASKIVWFSNTPDAIVRSQASERATKVGGASVQMVDFVVPGGTDEHDLKITENKTLVADYTSREGMREALLSMNP